MSNKVVTKRVSVTPAMAAKWLERNTHNRTVSQYVVDAYATDMKNGHWMFSHQGIAFDEDGNMIDGQHRLWAIVESGKTVDMLVTTGLSKESVNGVSITTMDVVDRGKVRGIGAQLTLSHGYKNGFLTAACAKVIAEICADAARNRLSTAQTVAILRIYGADIGSTIAEVRSKFDKGSSVLGTLAFVKRGNPDLGGKFADFYLSQENMKANHPAFALRRWIENHPQGGGSGRWQTVRAAASAIHLFSQGKTANRIYGSDEAMAWLRAMQKANVRTVNEITNPPRKPDEKK
jgi:hypothetical protein